MSWSSPPIVRAEDSFLLLATERSRLNNRLWLRRIERISNDLKKHLLRFEIARRARSVDVSVNKIVHVELQRKNKMLAISDSKIVSVVF